MKGVLVVRAMGVVLIVSQLSSCAWVAAWQSRWQNGASTSGTRPQPGPAKPTPPPEPPRPDKLPKPNPDPEPEPKPDPEPKPQPQPTNNNVPVARAVPGRPGFVFSPFNNKLIDVEGIRSGRLVADPHYPESEKKYFRVP